MGKPPDDLNGALGDGPRGSGFADFIAKADAMMAEYSDPDTKARLRLYKLVSIAIVEGLRREVELGEADMVANFDRLCTSIGYAVMSQVSSCPPLVPHSMDAGRRATQKIAEGIARYLSHHKGRDRG